MKPLDRLNRFLGRLPVHAAIIIMCLLWIIPTLGLFVTSFRTREAVRTTGWWTVFLPQGKPAGESEYNQYCSACHGSDGKGIPAADLSNPDLVNQYPSSSSTSLHTQGRTRHPLPYRHVFADPFRSGSKNQPALVGKLYRRLGRI
jgi:ABC-type glycerol-3-phosphate transport system permease component